MSGNFDITLRFFIRVGFFILAVSTFIIVFEPFTVDPHVTWCADKTNPTCANHRVSLAKGVLRLPVANTGGHAFVIDNASITGLDKKNVSVPCQDEVVVSPGEDKFITCDVNTSTIRSARITYTKYDKGSGPVYGITRSFQISLS